MSILIKRVYDKPSKEDGRRILIDRLWPRGLTKERARVDVWLKDIAPSTPLRKWFAHDPGKWAEFKKRYRAELQGKGELVSALEKHATSGKLTLVYGAKDTENNDAVVLKEYLETK